MTRAIAGLARNARTEHGERAIPQLRHSPDSRPTQTRPSEQPVSELGDDVDVELSVQSHEAVTKLSQDPGRLEGVSVVVGVWMPPKPDVSMKLPYRRRGRGFVDVAEGDDPAVRDRQADALGRLSCPVGDEPPWIRQSIANGRAWQSVRLVLRWRSGFSKWSPVG